jgi:hypothetical protein
MNISPCSYGTVTPSLLFVLCSSLTFTQFLFNNLVSVPPCLSSPRAAENAGTNAEEAEGLLSSPLDETAALPADLGTGGFDVVPEGQHTQVKPRSD